MEKKSAALLFPFSGGKGLQIFPSPSFISLGLSVFIWVRQNSVVYSGQLNANFPLWIKVGLPWRSWSDNTNKSPARPRMQRRSSFVQPGEFTWRIILAKRTLILLVPDFQSHLFAVHLCQRAATLRDCSLLQSPERLVEMRSVEYHAT